MPFRLPSVTAARLTLLGVLPLLALGCGPGRVSGSSSGEARALTEGEVYRVENRCSGLMLDVTGSSSALGAVVTQNPSISASSQLWKLNATATGAYVLVAQHDGMALDVFGRGTSDGSSVGQYTPNGQTNQAWQITKVSDGYVKLIPSHATAKALDVSGASQRAGARVQIWSDNGTCAQQWKLTRVLTSSDTDAGTPIPTDAGVPTSGTDVPEPTYTRVYALPNLDSRRDNTEALNAALDVARAGDCLTLPAGTFPHAGNIDVSRPGVTVKGAGSNLTVLLGTQSSTAGYRVLSGGNDHQLRDLTLRVQGASGRGDQNEQGMSTLLLETGVSGFVGQGLMLDGAKAAGFFSYGAHDYILNRVEVRNSLADGFHNTNGSYNGKFRDCIARNVGDDMFAVIHYENDALIHQSHDISFERVKGYGNTDGRGFGIVCVRDITVTDSEVNDTYAAGIYVGRETQANPAACTNIRFLGTNVINRANFGAPDHGAVFLLNGNSLEAVSNIHMENVFITDTNKNRSGGFAGQAVRAVIYGGGSVQAELKNFKFMGSNPVSTFGGNTDSNSNITRTGW